MIKLSPFHLYVCVCDYDGFLLFISIVLSFLSFTSIFIFIHSLILLYLSIFLNIRLTIATHIELYSVQYNISFLSIINRILTLIFMFFPTILLVLHFSATLLLLFFSVYNSVDIISFSFPFIQPQRKSPKLHAVQHWMVSVPRSLERDSAIGCDII